jgi:hypothetical protein
MTFGLPQKGQVNGMFEAENIRDWREHDVIDPDGKKIGQLEAVYVDTSTDEPAFGSIRIGMIGRRRLTFVPLDRAVVLPGQLRVAYSKSQVRDAPVVIDPDGELAASDEPELFKHYGLEYQAGVSGERQLARRLAVAGPRRGAVSPMMSALSGFIDFCRFLGGSDGAFSAADHRGHRTGDPGRGGQGAALPAVHRHRGLHRRLRRSWRPDPDAPTADAGPVRAAAAAVAVAAVAESSSSSALALSEPGSAW